MVFEEKNSIDKSKYVNLINRGAFMEKPNFSITMEEALENLSIASSIEDPFRIGIFEGKRLVEETEENASQAGLWLTKGSSEDLLEVMKQTFSVITHYLKRLYRSEDIDWNLPKTRNGLQSMMVLVGEAATKINKAIQIIEEKKKGVPKITTSSEYKILQEFYIDNITEKFSLAPPQGDEAWAEDLDQDTPIKDFESVRQDAEYELFYLKDPKNKPFFKRSLIKNMRLMMDFTEQVDLPLEDDPLLQIVTIKDRDLQGSASQILEGLKREIKTFYDLKIRLKKSEWINSLQSAIMSLMLAANQSNLMSHTLNKNCLKYFLDFQFFLKKALQSDEYQKSITYIPDSSGQTEKFLLKFTHHLAYEFFTRSSSIRQEILGYIHRLIRKGKELSEQKNAKASSIWEEFLEENEHLENLLKRYPSGPLFKILDTLQQEQGKEIVFEPLQQENMPFLLFSVQMPEKISHILHLPTPTKQSSLEKAELSEEFRAFLSCLHESKKEQKRHLLLNLQDRTSWKESTRATLLENLQKRAEYSENISVITLPKDTAFYHQSEEYQEMDTAKDFLKSLQEQMEHPEDFGFFFSKSFEKSYGFIKKLIQLIFTQIFASRKKLSRQERCDFIEILYFFLTLKVFEETKPDTVSFTCKDALDTGAMMSAGFFAFLKILQGSSFTKKEKDHLRLLVYAPVLMVRERSINAKRLVRTMSSLATLDKQLSKKKIQEFAKIFSKDLFNTIQIL